jgi:hypothetical protein
VEKARGNVLSLGGGKTMRWDLEAGLLLPVEAREMEDRISRILKA